MNVRNFLKCEVCGSITLVRTQLGWLEQHPIRVYCGRCGILLSGTVFQNPTEGTFRFEFSNSQVIESTRPDYYIEASGELLTEKLQPYIGPDDVPYITPPFFNSFFAMGHENYLQFAGKTGEFLHRCKKDWPKVRRVLELWLSGRFEFLKEEIGRYLSEKEFPLNNELEYLRGVHQLYLLFFHNVIPNDFFDAVTPFLFNEIHQILENNPDGLRKLVQEFGGQGLLHRYEENIFALLNEFVSKFQYLIPIFGLQFSQESSLPLMRTKGITTASFEDLKQLYLDFYEVAGDAVSLIVAYNNLKYRRDFQVMAGRRKDIQTLSHFDGKSKGTRCGLVDGTEAFDTLVFPYLDTKLRNAIGHHSYNYDGVNQIIVYYPSGNEVVSDRNEISLLTFTEKCWHLFESINNLAELIYQTRKIHLVSIGYTSNVDPSAFRSKTNTKTGRNEPCPCGSGKQFKKCCGSTK